MASETHDKAAHRAERKRERASRRATRDSALGALLDRADALIYVLVAICFLAAALLSLVYGVVNFAQTLDTILLQSQINSTPQAIITFVSDLLLTVIIMEVLGTVVHYIRTRETSVRPFLFIGIISATRNILAVGAQLSINESTLSITNSKVPPQFTTWMVELGVNAAVIIALGVTMRLIGNLLGDGLSESGLAMDDLEDDEMAEHATALAHQSESADPRA